MSQYGSTSGVDFQRWSTVGSTTGLQINSELTGTARPGGFVSDDTKSRNLSAIATNMDIDLPTIKLSSPLMRITTVTSTPHVLLRVLGAGRPTAWLDKH